MEQDIVVAYITASSIEEARIIGRTLVEERLAACVNVLGEIDSVYRWAGTVEESREAALIAKTTARRFDALVERVRAIHSYELPCVIRLAVDGGNASYLAWIAKETDPGQRS